MGVEPKRQAIEGMEKSVWASEGNGSLAFWNLANGQPFAPKNLGNVRLGFSETASRIGNQRALFLRLPINRPPPAHTRSYIGDLATTRQGSP
jgi:hypothetical protein